ncbi:hypothetical protein UA08_07485 [Talaromyces atroroseus]|uniref:Altered inheritance of mitochondria protein 41 n=1 Tax=Talaromyces atroroseus TaxID=1441469 RepID=A0A225ANF3_TALAT|nr:hypothetical protein UA08_07485 [Talaromyces atroroseus]OKL57129.1 hypothetical protein UA08_07485 [Talaromyces atroroseus]
MFNSLRFSSRVGLRAVRWNSTSSIPVPPLMAKLRSDLKDAMRAKDVSRLNVLRALISETNNAAKTTSPIQTDVQLLSLIEKKIAGAKDAADMFATANRSDLKEKEEAQIAVLEEYASQIDRLSTEDIRAAVSEVISQLQSENSKITVGILLKNLLSPGKLLDGKPAAKSDIVQVINELLPEK